MVVIYYPDSDLKKFKLITMKKLSYWSNRNPVKARIIIGVSHVVLIILALITGINTYIEEIHFSERLLFVLVNLFFLAYIFYPKRGHKEGFFIYSYHRRIRHDVTLLLSSFLILTIGVNRFAYSPIHQEEQAYEIRLMVFKPGVPNVTSKENRSELFRMFKSFRKDVKQKLNALKIDRQSHQDFTTAGKVALILLTLLLAAGVAGMVAVFACNIACSGNEGLAWAVLVGGAIGIVWLTVVVISKILRAGKEKEKVSHL